jgi:TolB-like protein
LTRRWFVLFVAGCTLLGWSAVWAQTSGPPARIRLVVFQFNALPNDASHRGLAASVARSLVDSLSKDPALQLMSHPRGARTGSRSSGDAQYAIIGTVAELPGRIRVDVRIADIQHVQVVAFESVNQPDATAVSIAASAKALAARIHDRLVLPAPAAP